MDHRHPAAEAREKERLFHRRIAAADDDDLFFAEESPVAGGARGDAAAAQLRFPGNVEPARAGAGRDDDGLGLVLVLSGANHERFAREVHARRVHVFNARAEPFGLLAKLDHEIGSHNAVGEARVVLDLSREHELAAVLSPRENQRREICPRRVDGGGQSGGAGSDDDDALHTVAFDCRGRAPGCTGGRRRAGNSSPAL